MYIIDYVEEGEIHVYRKHNSNVSKKKIYKTIEQYFTILGNRELLNNLSDEYIFLLHESYFVLHSFDIHIKCEKNVKLQDIKSIVEKRIKLLKQKYGCEGWGSCYEIKNIIIDGKKQQFVYGKSGEIQFMLCIFFLTNFGSHVCELLGGKKVFSHPQIKFYPKHFFFLKYLSKTYRKSEYTILNIGGKETQLIFVNKHWYKTIAVLNVGSYVLKEAYQEQGVMQYFFAKQREIEKNVVLLKIISDIVSFFGRTLSCRIGQHVSLGGDLIVLGDLVKNEMFLHHFQDIYQRMHHGYLISIGSLTQKSRTVGGINMPIYLMGLFD